MLKKANERPGAVPVEDIWTGEMKKEAKKSKGKSGTGRRVAKPKGSKNKDKPKM